MKRALNSQNSKEKDPTKPVKDLMNQLEGVDLHDKRGGKFKFQIHLTGVIRQTPVDALELSVRAYHCLMRYGYATIGDLVEGIAAGDDLSKIRNCGKTSIQEIMVHLFLFQYNSLPANRRDLYLIETVLINRNKNDENDKTV